MGLVQAAGMNRIYVQHKWGAWMFESRSTCSRCGVLREFVRWQGCCMICFYFDPRTGERVTKPGPCAP